MGVKIKNHRETIYGKGDNPRPVDRKKFDENYDRIFGKKKQKGRDSERTSS